MKANYVKLEVGERAASKYETHREKSTQDSVKNTENRFKMHIVDKNVLSGSKKVNFEEKRKKENYRRINEMLGGN